MSSLLFTVVGAVMNTLAFSGTNFVLSRFTDHGEEERKRYDLALGMLQKVRDDWNKDQTKQLNFANKRVREKNKAKTCIRNVDEAMLECYRVFATQIKPLPPDPQLLHFHHRSDDQKNG